MKILLLLIAWISSSSLMFAGDLKEETRYIGFLHQLQYVETIEDLKKLITDCPPPHPDAGEDNSEITVKTKLFGCDAVGEFNFHKGVLVSHGFNVLTKTYEDAHHAFLEAATILNSQTDKVKTSVSLPTDKDYMDCPSAPPDKITIYVDGVSEAASFQLRLEMKGGSLIVGWGAQKVSPSEKIQIEQAGADQPTTAPELKPEGKDKPQPESKVAPR